MITMSRKNIWLANVTHVADVLRDRYADWHHYNRKNPLEELIFIICSIQTNEVLYRSTFSSLRNAFPRFSQLANAPKDSIARAIVKGGLSNQKAIILKSLLRAIHFRFGSTTLAPLRRMSDREREIILTSLPCVGRKSARCVMMYSFGSCVFPVDTNCWRICRRLGWIRPTRSNNSCSPRDMDRLQAKIPPDLRYTLHVNMVSLGREICTPISPRCNNCPIRRYCKQVGIHQHVKH